MSHVSTMATTQRLRWLVTHVASGPSPTCEDRHIEGDEEWGVLKTTAITWAGWNPHQHKVLPEQFWGIRGSEVQTGDVVVTKAGPRHRVGVAAYVDEAPRRLAVSGKMILLRPDPAVVDPRFLAWFLATPRPQAYLDACKTGMAESQMNFANEDLLGLRVELPPLDLQRSIADFLDIETRKLDELVSKKLRLISLMEERINSRVLEHVGTSQLVHPVTGNPVLPIRRVLNKVVRPAIAGEGIITAFRDGQVTERGRRRAEGYTQSASTEPQGQHVQVGDVVVHGLDGFAGAIGTSEAQGNCSPVYHVCTPANEGDARFLSRLLRLLALQGYLGNFAISTRERAVDFRNWDLFGRIPVPFVPALEQREIGNWITKLRPLRAAVEQSKALAAERRQALVTAVVTGQFDVTTASGRNVTEGVSA
ncbi:restriction endonuclease subunit S [Streptomyces pilosus]